MAAPTDLAPHPDAPPVGAPLPRHWRGCFGCGDVEAGLRMRMRVVDELTCACTMTIEPRHEGAPGLIHGGVITAIFDEALGSLQVFVQERAVTASLTTDFRRPIPIGATVHVRSTLDRRDGRKLWGSGAIHLGTADGPVAAQASGLFVVVPDEHFAPYRG